MCSQHMNSDDTKIFCPSVVPRTLRMETSVKATEVLVPPQPEVASSSPDADHPEGAACSGASSDDFIDPMVEFSRQLEDIITAHGSAASTLEKQVGQVASNNLLTHF